MSYQMTTGERWLVGRANAGDAEAWNDLLESQRVALRAAVAAQLDRRVGPRIDPSDVVQETLMDASRRYTRYLAAPPGCFFGWIRRLARDRVIDAHRRLIFSQRRSVSREDRPPAPPGGDVAGPGRALPAPDTSPSERLQRKERLARVMEALADLPPRDREIVVMRHLEQRSAAELAGAFGVSVGAVEVRLVRALERLRDRLEGA